VRVLNLVHVLNLGTIYLHKLEIPRMNQISVIPIQPVHTSMRMCYVIFYILVDQFGTTDHESHLRTSHRHRPMFILVY
jgi:hypothetical protein